MFLRAMWAVIGLFLSLPAIAPPLAGAIMLVAIVSLTGGPFFQRLFAVWHQPVILLFLALSALFCLYWLCVGWLVIQFVRGRELSSVALGIVTITIVGTLAFARPWHTEAEPFTLGPDSLLHVAFIATIVGASSRRSLLFRRNDNA